MKGKQSVVLSLKYLFTIQAKISLMFTAFLAVWFLSRKRIASNKQVLLTFGGSDPRGTANTERCTLRLLTV